MLPKQRNPCTKCKTAQQCTTSGRPLPFLKVTSGYVQYCKECGAEQTDTQTVVATIHFTQLCLMQSVTRTTNTPSDVRHLEFIDGWNEWTTVGEQQANDFESVEILMAHDGALTVVVGKLQLCFHQQTVQHPAHTHRSA